MRSAFHEVDLWVVRVAAHTAMSRLKLLVHSCLSVTQKYLHPEVDKAAEIVNKRNRKAAVLPDITAHAVWVN